MKTISKILYPIEFSHHDYSAIKPISKFAENNNASLEILHVVENNFPPYQLLEPSKELEATAENYLDKFIKDHAGTAEDVKTNVISGKVNKEILKYIEEKQPDLVIMPSKSEEEAGTEYLGGTAYRVLSSSNVPVITMTQPPKTLEPKKILIPIDVDFGIAEAKESLYRYFSDGNPEIELMIVVDPDEYKEEEAREMRILDYEVGKFRELGFPAIHGKKIDHKDPASAIVDRAKEGDFDMVVMCTHGRTGVSRFLMGSTTAEVIRTSKVPVFTVKTERKVDGSRYYAENLPV